MMIDDVDKGLWYFIEAMIMLNSFILSPHYNPLLSSIQHHNIHFILSSS